jgi:hypothetical protein
MRGTHLSPAARDLAERIMQLVLDRPWWVSGLLIAVVPAICEELFFRGWLLAAWAGEQPSRRRAVAAVLGQAAVFAAFHLLPERMPQTFMLGVMLGWMTLATGSLLPAVLAHLQGLGVTTVCLMPVAHRADEARLQAQGLSNYWGYSPVAWSAPEARYASQGPASDPRAEFRAMVDALHGAGLEVVVDVVYNHTAELDEWGPTLSLRGIDNALYYHLLPGQQHRYANWTGCGNCVNFDQPLVRRLVLESLRRLCAGRTAIVATHSRAAQRILGRVLEIEAGRAAGARMAGE